MNIDKLRTELSQINDFDFVGGVAPEAIASAEAELGVPFPPDYQAFLREFGSGYVSSESIAGLGGAKHLDVVWLTKELRSRSSNQFPSDFLPLRNDGFGNYDCIDISSRPVSGECRIVEFARDGIRANIVSWQIISSIGFAISFTSFANSTLKKTDTES